MKPVQSGEPQGTVLGPLCFLLYINNIGDLISPCSSIRLFVDDYLHYRTVNSTESCQQLQNDLIRLVEWSKQWQMTFHPTKCFILKVKRNPVIYNYKMMGHQLEIVHHYPYLAVELSEDMNWDPHISKATSKANKTLGFLRRKLNKCMILRKVHESHSYDPTLSTLLRYGTHTDSASSTRSKWYKNEPPVL